MQVRNSYTVFKLAPYLFENPQRIIFCHHFHLGSFLRRGRKLTESAVEEKYIVVKNKIEKMKDERFSQ